MYHMTVKVIDRFGIDISTNHKPVATEREFMEFIENTYRAYFYHSDFDGDREVIVEVNRREDGQYIPVRTSSMKRKHSDYSNLTLEH